MKVETVKKVYIKGYINLEDDGYTFIYENSRLTLISIENKPTFFSEYKKIEYFKGFTLNGFDIVFYINNNIYYKDGCYICSPRCIIISQNKKYKLDEAKFDSLSISGGILNRFYSNRKMIELDIDKYTKNKKDYFNIKKVEETISEEKVNLNGVDTSFELSIKKPGWKDDGSIVFNNYDSLLRVKYNFSKDYISVIKDLISIERFFKFCANRNSISVDNIFLEIKNDDGKYIKSVEVILPYMIDNEVNKEILPYEIFENHLNDIFTCLDKSNYLFSIIPDDNKSFEIISNKDYCSVISCFQSIYQYVHGSNEELEKTAEEIKLEEVKTEIKPILEKIKNNYKGKDREKRDFIERFINIIETANLKLEKCISKEFEKSKYLIDTIYHKGKDEIEKKGLVESIRQAINNRDDITHNKTIQLDDISIGIYEIIYKLNYIMILKHIGVEKEKIEKIIRNLAIRGII
jgi:hypothetical protein